MTVRRDMRLRIGLGAIGTALGLFGAFRLLTQVPLSDLVTLLIWLIAAVVLHDGVIAPLTAAVGVGFERFVPPRARRAVAYGLTAAVGAVVIGLGEIYRQGTAPPQKALLRQNYTGNLGIALGIIAAVALLAYVASVLRSRSKPRPSDTNVRASDDQVTSTE